MSLGALLFNPNVCRGEDGKLERSRRFSVALDRVHADQHGSVVEPELDMNRQHRPESSLLLRLWRLIQWLTPESGMVGPPMRSIARELEERFPSRDI
jgi:hypothetical protein